MTLSEAITRNNIAYAKWRAYGQHEADGILNDSTRERGIGWVAYR